jgi:hypothetical protein
MAKTRPRTARKAARPAAAKKSTSPSNARRGAKATRKRASPAPAKKVATENPKPDNDKIVRDNFKMPAQDYQLIAALKKRCLALGIAIKKNELLRAGLSAINRMPDDTLRDTMSSVASRGGARGGKDKRNRGKADAG